MKDLKSGDKITFEYMSPINRTIQKITDAKIMIPPNGFFWYICSNCQLFDGGHGGEKLGYKYKWLINQTRPEMIRNIQKLITIKQQTYLITNKGKEFNIKN